MNVPPPSQMHYTFLNTITTETTETRTQAFTLLIPKYSQQEWHKYHLKEQYRLLMRLMKELSQNKAG